MTDKIMSWYKNCYCYETNPREMEAHILFIKLWGYDVPLFFTNDADL